MEDGKLLKDVIVWAISIFGIAIYLIYRRGRKLREDEEDRKKLNRIKEIVNVYGKFMIECQMGLGDIHDVSELPYAKHDIANAILTSIYMSNDQHNVQDKLTQGLMFLAYFQENVGEPLNDPLDLILRNDINIETTDKEKLLRHIESINAAASDDSGHEIRRKALLDRAYQEEQYFLAKANAIASAGNKRSQSHQ